MNKNIVILLPTAERAHDKAKTAIEVLQDSDHLYGHSHIIQRAHLSLISVLPQHPPNQRYFRTVPDIPSESKAP